MQAEMTEVDVKSMRRARRTRDRQGGVNQQTRINPVKVHDSRRERKQWRAEINEDW